MKKLKTNKFQIRKGEQREADHKMLIVFLCHFPELFKEFRSTRDSKSLKRIKQITENLTCNKCTDYTGQVCKGRSLDSSGILSCMINKAVRAHWKSTGLGTAFLDADHETLEPLNPLHPENTYSGYAS